MLSVSGSLEIPYASGNIGFGVAIDPNGNVAIPAFGFLGGSAGAAESLTVNYTTSNARNFQEFGGFFAEGGAVGGALIGGGTARFAGPGGVHGNTYSIGEALGLDIYGGFSYTDVGPTLNFVGC